MKFYRVEKSQSEINSFYGEAGYGIYATPNENVLNYYKKNTNSYRIITFTTNQAEIIDLDSMKDLLIRFIKNELDELAKRMVGYIKPKVNYSNYHRFSHSIQKFIQGFNCDAYIININMRACQLESKLLF